MHNRHAINVFFLCSRQIYFQYDNLNKPVKFLNKPVRFCLECSVFDLNKESESYILYVTLGGRSGPREEQS